MNRKKSVQTAAEIRRKSKITTVAGNCSQNLLEKRRLRTMCSDIDKAKTKKVDEIDSQMRMLLLRYQCLMTSRSPNKENLSETFFFEPGFRFHKDGSLRKLQSTGLTDVDKSLPGNVDRAVKDTVQGKFCPLAHVHIEACRIKSMSMFELNNEIDQLTEVLHKAQCDADKIVREQKKKQQKRGPKHYLHAHTNDFIPTFLDASGTPLINKSTNKRLSAIPNAAVQCIRRDSFRSCKSSCVACEVRMKAPDTQENLKRFFRNRDNQWTRWKIAPSGVFVDKNCTPTRLFFNKQQDDSEFHGNQFVDRVFDENVTTFPKISGLPDTPLRTPLGASGTSLDPEINTLHSNYGVIQNKLLQRLKSSVETGPSRTEVVRGTQSKPTSKKFLAYSSEEMSTFLKKHTSLSKQMFGAESFEPDDTTIAKRQSLRERAERDVADVNKKVCAFLGTLPEAEPAVKIWRNSMGQMIQFTPSKQKQQSEQDGDTDRDESSEDEWDGNEIIHSASDIVSDGELAADFTRPKPYVSPWCKVGTDFFKRNVDPNSIESLRQCHYLRPYSMKVLPSDLPPNIIQDDSTIVRDGSI